MTTERKLTFVALAQDVEQTKKKKKPFRVLFSMALRKLRNVFHFAIDWKLYPVGPLNSLILYKKLKLPLFEYGFRI